MATRVIDDSKLQNIAVAIQSKDNGGQMTVEEMPGRIEAIPSGAPVVSNPALILWDWEGTKLAAYSREDALALTELLAPETLFPYAGADHDLLVFQSWNWSLANIKAWIQAHAGKTLDVGAIYTTTDGVDHSFWNNPRLDTAQTISMQKRGTASVAADAFAGCRSLAHINLPNGVRDVNTNAFSGCYSLKHINIPNGVTFINVSAFYGCCSLVRANLPDGITSVYSNAFAYCYSLAHVNLPDSITSIYSYAFANCFSLTHIRLPDGITTMSSNVFANCYSLARVNIPESLTHIDGSTFNGCAALCDILNGSNATLAHVNAFGGLPENYRIYVPRTNLSWFETETNWATIYTQGHIVAIEDYIDYLESIGFNVDKYKGATA